MGTNKSGRMPYIDAMKGISIILVAFLHSFMNTERNRESEYAAIMNFLSYLAVPAFFFINGYLYNHKYSLTPIKSIIKKFKAYYIPFVGFSIFFWLFRNVFVKLHLTSESAYSIKDYVKNFVLIFAMHLESELNGAMWFLRGLLFMVCGFICIDFFAQKIKKKNLRYVVLAIIMLVMHFLGKSVIKTDAYTINRVLWDYIYFYFGTVVRDYELDKVISRHRTLVFVVGTIMFTISCHFFKGGFGVNEHFLDIPGTLCGILALFALSGYEAVSECRLLHLLGNASMDIMCLHFLAFKVPSLIFILTRGLDIERLSDTPVLKGTHGFDFMLYGIVALVLCTLEYCIRNNIKKKIIKKESAL